jgi:bifunctional non-homologous end joining protein LigD
VADRLKTYRGKRRAEETPEPSGKSLPKKGKARRFVIQEHHARRLHWDLRLERDGVLVSWAVPKGIPEDPKTNRLAVHVEDHPLDYIDFAGEIPAGNYGAGKVKVWDSGTYDEHKWRDDEVMVTFHGERVQGKYVLFRTRGDDWMIHRMDPPADPDREPMPEHVEPMKARLGELPPNESDYAYEIKWDGIRAVAFVESGGLRLENRNLRDVTGQYPELRQLGPANTGHDMVLDGEIVAFDDSGRPSFERLQGRMHLGSDSAVRRRMKEIPAAYMIFDLLWLDGHSTMGLPYVERRELLEDLKLAGPTWQTPERHTGDGKKLLEVSREQGLEGIVAKRLDSRYEPERRSGAWIKVKNHRRQELVVGGWMPGKAGRRGKLGSLLVGVYDATPSEAKKRGEPQRLLYAGRVGTGFKAEDLQLLADLLEPLRSKESPFDGRQPPKEAVFVKPRIVAEVEFLEWTRAGTLRAPSYKGLRDDREPREVVREEV